MKIEKYFKHPWFQIPFADPEQGLSYTISGHWNLFESLRVNKTVGIFHFILSLPFRKIGQEYLQRIGSIIVLFINAA